MKKSPKLTPAEKRHRKMMPEQDARLAFLSEVVEPDGRLKAINDECVQKYGGLEAVLPFLATKFWGEEPPGRISALRKTACNPVKCLSLLMAYGCMTEVEVMAVLAMPVRFVELHRRFYNPELTEEKVGPFIVAFGEFLRMILNLHGIQVDPRTAANEVGLFNYYGMPGHYRLPAVKDEVAESYRRQLLRNGEFRADAKILINRVQLKTWAYLLEFGWLAAFDADIRYDQGLSEILELSGLGSEHVPGAANAPSQTTVRSLSESFCDKWSLSHFAVDGRSHGSHGLDMQFEVRRVRVRRQTYGITCVEIPRYYKPNHVIEHMKRDFAAMAEALAPPGPDYAPVLKAERQPKEDDTRAKRVAMVKFLVGIARKGCLAEREKDMIDEISAADDPREKNRERLKRRRAIEREHRKQAERKAYGLLLALTGMTAETIQKYNLKSPSGGSTFSPSRKDAANLFQRYLAKFGSRTDRSVWIKHRKFLDLDSVIAPEVLGRRG